MSVSNPSNNQFENNKVDTNLICSGGGNCSRLRYKLTGIASITTMIVTGEGKKRRVAETLVITEVKIRIPICVK